MIPTSLTSSVMTFSSIKSGSDIRQRSEGLSTASAAAQLGVIAEQMQETMDQDEAKIRAAKKIADAREQLSFLQRGGFPSDVIANFASQLVGQLRSAAAQYAQAIAVAGSTSTAAPQSVPIAHSVSEVMDSDDANAGVPDGDRETNLVQNAYQSGSDDGYEWYSRAENDNILQELEALARQARQLATHDGHEI